MSAGHLESIRTRDNVETRPGTLEFRAAASAADAARRRLIPFLDDVRSTCGPLHSASATEARLRGSQDSHKRPFSEREALTP